jgi:hypothetical protein
MEKEKLELYTDYLICNSGLATATGLSAVLDGEISHDKITRFLSERDYKVAIQKLFNIFQEKLMT